MIDLWTSRRKAFLECDYWKQNENEYIVFGNQIEYENFPSGFFKAEFVTKINDANQNLENSFLLKETSFTISTYDDVSNLEINDIVRINGEEKKYRVNSINKSPTKKQTQFLIDKVSYQYFINLRG